MLDPTAIGPVYVLIPAMLTSAPVGLATKPLPLSVSAIVPVPLCEVPKVLALPLAPANASEAPDATETPDEFPNPVGLIKLRLPELICN